MKKLFIVFILFLIPFTYSQDKGFGLGLVVGEPTGISAKYWLSSQNALDFGLGYSFSSNANRFHLNVDYVWHNENVIRSKERLPLFYGIGGRIKTREKDNASVSVRGILGLLWYPRYVPIDLFVEVVPVLRIVPDTNLEFDAGVGIRYFFK